MGGTAYPRDDRDILHAALLLRAAFGAHLPHVFESVLHQADYYPRVSASRTDSEVAGRYSYLKLQVPPAHLCASAAPVRALSVRLQHPWAARESTWSQAGGAAVRRDPHTHLRQLYWMQHWQLEAHVAADENEGPNNMRIGGWAARLADDACPDLFAAMSSQSGLQRPPGGPLHIADTFYPDELAGGEEGRECFARFVRGLAPGTYVSLHCYYHNDCNFDVGRPESGWVGYGELELYLDWRVDFNRMLIRPLVPYQVETPAVCG